MALFALLPLSAVVGEEKPNKVVTPILDVSTFYPIKGDESYHQD